MKRLLIALTLLCYFMAGSNHPAAYFFAVSGPVVGFLALAVCLRCAVSDRATTNP